MNIRTLADWLLIFSSGCLVCSVSARPLCAGQSYPHHVTVFGQSSGDSGASQKVDPATEADIRQLMDLLGMKATVARTMKNTADGMRPLLLRAFPAGPYRERLVQLFFEKFRTNMDPDYILNLTIPAYAQYLSDDEVKQLIQFYKTPLGQKWVSVQPKVAAGLAPTARSWGSKIARQSMTEVLQEHPDLAKQLKAAAQAARQH
jgi:hypothetical protein